jgi:hypothetical protein
MKREVEESVCAVEEQSLKKRYRHTDDDIASWKVRENLAKTRESFSAYAKFASDPGGERMLTIEDHVNLDLARQKFYALRENCSRQRKPQQPERQAAGTSMIDSTSVVSLTSITSKGSGGSKTSSADASMEGVDSAANSGSGATRPKRPSSLDNAQIEANAMNKLLHGEWNVKLDSGSIWGKAYVSPSMSYLAQRKRKETIPFHIAGEGTEASPFILHAKRMTSATLVSSGPDFLVWQMQKGTRSTWTRPS